MMKKIILFLLFSVFLSAQKIGVIELKQSIKDKKAFSKSLTLIDNRENKEIGKVTEKEGFGEMEFANEDLKSSILNWYSEDNKGTGNNDIVLMLEELKIYDEQTPNEKIMFGKAKIKISSFLKRNDKYYLINRFDNVIVCDPRKTSSIVKYLSQNISDVITEFIRASYTNLVLGQYIPENEINNYYSYLIKNNKSLAPELKDGVYLDFKTFSNQEPAFGYFIEKNKKGRFVRMKNKEEIVSLSNAFIYVEAGKAYRFTPVGFLEMKKNEKGFYIIASRAELFAETKTGGMMIGAIAGGIVGAAIGAAIDSGSNKGAMNGFGFKSVTMTNVYIDSLTGSFNFEQ